MTEPDFLRTTRESYDSVATDYADRFYDELASKPLDRALFTGFAELVKAASAGPVADIGSGPGRVTSFLRGLGLNAFGIDLSPEMVALARRAHPDVLFEVGSMMALDLSDGVLGGIVANYSIIHIPQDKLPTVFAEFYRVLAPGGYAILVFQVGDEHLHRTEAFGHPVSFDTYRRRPEQIAELLSQAGFVMRAQMIREPDEKETQQAYLLVRKPA